MRKRRLSKVVQRRLINHFVAGTTARCAASLVGVNLKLLPSIASYNISAIIISQQLELASEEVFKGKIEVDESYLGGMRKSKRGRGAGGKVPVFWVLKRGGRVYTKIIPDASGSTLILIIERKVVPDSIVYSDDWKGYNVLDVSD